MEDPERPLLENRALLGCGLDVSWRTDMGVFPCLLGFVGWFMYEARRNPGGMLGKGH